MEEFEYRKLELNRIEASYVNGLGSIVQFNNKKFFIELIGLFIVFIIIGIIASIPLHFFNYEWLDNLYILFMSFIFIIINSINYKNSVKILKNRDGLSYIILKFMSVLMLLVYILSIAMIIIMFLNIFKIVNLFEVIKKFY